AARRHSRRHPGDSAHCCAARADVPLRLEKVRRSMNEAAIFQATTKDEIAAARELFEEYAAWLGVDLCFQNFQRELDTLPGAYAPPCGRLLLARVNDALAGCVAVRPLEDAVAEMKRLYVRPAFRGTGLGRNLVRHMIEKARQSGYRALRLDTLRRM